MCVLNLMFLLLFHQAPHDPKCHAMRGSGLPLLLRYNTAPLWHSQHITTGCGHTRPSLRLEDTTGTRKCSHGSGKLDVDRDHKSAVSSVMNSIFFDQSVSSHPRKQDGTLLRPTLRSHGAFTVSRENHISV